VDELNSWDSQILLASAYLTIKVALQTSSSLFPRFYYRNYPEKLKKIHKFQLMNAFGQEEAKSA
jgi:hypothetical protein